MLFRFQEMVIGSYRPGGRQPCAAAADTDGMSLHNVNFGKNFSLFYFMLLKNMGESVILGASGLCAPSHARQ